MKVFTCSNCRNPLYFENSECLNCGNPVGFDPVSMAMVTLKPSVNPDIYSCLPDLEQEFKYCGNAVHGVCNWLIPAGSVFRFCLACGMNRIIPSIDQNINLKRWKHIETAKHRLIHSLLKLKLPFQIVNDGNPETLLFDFMEDAPTGERVMTGHDNGIITINVSEADETERVKNKQHLGERYRTLLGHFRHESGHYYWDVLIRNSSYLEEYRRLFGNEQSDYSASLSAYYAKRTSTEWNEHFVSPYASSHPWEDWAETWAHFLHMMDTLETSWSFGISINPIDLEHHSGSIIASVEDPYGVEDFDQLVTRWIALCFAVNSLNRSMGHQDFYPFILSVPVINKLRFIHKVCRESMPAPVETPVHAAVFEAATYNLNT